MNTDTQTSPGIGLLDSKFAVLGGCIVDLLGTNGKRITAQVSAGRLFRGWAAGFQPTSWPIIPSPPEWLVIGTQAFDGATLTAALGGGVAKANIRITLSDGDSGSPNPAYVAMFGAGHFPYLRANTQPGDYDFDGGTNLYFGFQDAAGNPVNCGFMGAATTYRLDAAGATYDTFTGLPGIFALTDPQFAAIPHPAHYMTPVQPGQTPGVWPVTAWFTVPDDQLDTLYNVLGTGSLSVGIHDVTPGDQFYDFTQGLASDIVDIPFDTVPPSLNPIAAYLDLWVWRELHRFTGLDQDLQFPPGFQKALLYALALEYFPEYPDAGKKYDFEELAAEAEDALKDLEILDASDAVAMEPPV